MLAVTSTGVLRLRVAHFRQNSIQQLQILSQAIASNSTAALAFDNADDAASVLAAFKADPHIAAAALYDARVRLFATYPKDSNASSFPSRPAASGYSSSARLLVRLQAGHGGIRAAGAVSMSGRIWAMYARMNSTR